MDKFEETLFSLWLIFLVAGKRALVYHCPCVFIPSLLPHFDMSHCLRIFIFPGSMLKNVEILLLPFALFLYYFSHFWKLFFQK